MTLPKFDNWLAHGWGVHADTPEMLFRTITAISLGQDRIYAWRGQNDSAWPFISSLARNLSDRGVDLTEEKMRERELEIVAGARRWGLGRELGSSATDMHILAVLQHHGVHTRLIDVTSNPMTALWFATADHHPEDKAEHEGGTLFAIDVTGTRWYETFSFNELTWGHVQKPLAATYHFALLDSAARKLEKDEGHAEEGDGEHADGPAMFRVFSALPDERMKAQEGWFLGSAVPSHHLAPGIVGVHPLGEAPSPDDLAGLTSTDRDPDASFHLPFCAITFSEDVKAQLRLPLKRTFNRRRRVLFPDVDGFRDAFERDEID